MTDNLIHKKKIHIIQLGCASNQADGIKIATNLGSNSELTLKIEEANVIIIMSCGFSKKQYQETINVISEVNKIKNVGAEIWVGGCVPAINKNFQLELPFKIDKYFTPRDFDFLINKSSGNIQFNENEIESLLKIKLNSYPIRIANGCSENCSYCVIKRAGGKTKSKTISEIILEIQLINKNVNSVCLVGEDIGSFGEDSGDQLFDLISEIIQVSPELKITFSAIHPKYFIKNLEYYKKIYKFKNIIPLLPLPIQSGSNKILELMKRDYKIESVISSLNSFMHDFPQVKLSTDVMVGFPGESWEDFILTQRMVHELSISALDCFKYDDMNRYGDTIEETEKIKRLKIVALTFIRNYCKEKEISNPKQFNNFLSNNKIPINLNF